jgi:hypothetical protein
LSGHFWKNIICSRFRENNRIDSTFWEKTWLAAYSGENMRGPTFMEKT